MGSGALMAGPWEAFQAPSAAAEPAQGPWTAYQQQPEQPSTLRRIAGNVAGAAARGISNAIGLPGDIAQGMDRATDWIGQQVTGNPDWRMRPPPPTIGGVQMPSRLFPTSGDVRDVARATGIPVDQRAETPGGRIVQDAIEGGLSLPGNLPSMAYGALSGAGGAVAAEGASAGGFGPTGQTVARIAGSVAAPLVAGRVVGASQRAANPPPTTEALRDASQRAYDAARNAGVAVNSGRVGQLVTDLGQTLRREGFDEVLHPAAARALTRLEQAASSGAPQSLDEIDILRRVINEAGKSNSASERRIAGIMVDHLDNWVAGLGPRDVTQGAANVGQATAALNEARNLWGRARRGEIIEDLIDRAQTRASQFTGSGLENALRTEFRQLAMNEKRMRGFSDAERQAIEAVSRGGPVINIMRGLGKLAPTGVVSTALGGSIGAGAGSIAGPIGSAVGAVAAPVIGAAARGTATRMTMNAAQRAAETARAGGGALPQSTAEAISEVVAALAAEREAQRWGDPAYGARIPTTAR